MHERLHNAIHEGWSSLQFMMAGGLRGQVAEMSIVIPDGTEMSVQQVFEMEVLGALVCDDGCQRQALDYRLGKAEAVFHKYRKILCAKGAHAEKMRAWGSTAMASASSCSGALALTRELAHHIDSWEHRYLRQVLRLRPTAEQVQCGEGWQAYHEKSRRIIAGVQQKPLHHV